MNDMTKTIKPCPFCKGKVITIQIPDNTEEETRLHPRWVWRNPGSWMIGCKTIMCKGNINNTSTVFDSEEEAIQAWNQNMWENGELKRRITKDKAIENLYAIKNKYTWSIGGDDALDLASETLKRWEDMIPKYDIIALLENEAKRRKETWDEHNDECAYGEMNALSSAIELIKTYNWEEQND